MHEYYHKLIAFRKANAALNNTNRNATKAEADETNKMLRLQRWSDNQRLECVFNFSHVDQRYNWPNGRIVFNSSVGHTLNQISAESILIFELQ
jgi:glycosidase